MTLLNDHEVQEFITNGFLRLQPDVDHEIHENINQKLRYATEHEFPMGNNIVSRVPALWDIVRCPRIHGALVSLLGPRYFVHPHRAIHTSVPVEDPSINYAEDHNGPPLGKGSMAGSGWHQDAHSPLSRARHHVPRYLIGFYFPHDTPKTMGPTRVQAGSYLYAQPVEPHAVVVPEDVTAGTFLLLHFDTVHAGWVNRLEQTRYMVKFVFTRTEHPSAPTWNHDNAIWQRPKRCIPAFDVEPAWSFIWDWMRGVSQRSPFATSKTESHYAALNGTDQVARLNAIYSLAHVSEIKEHTARIDSLVGSGMHERALVTNDNGKPTPRDDIKGYPRRWNERAVVVDDSAYALAAVGEAAVPALSSLLESSDPWVVINALFALGEIGPAAHDGLSQVIHLLNHPKQQVVRQALDTLGAIGGDISNALPKIHSLLVETNPDWQTPEVFRGWTGQDQVRLNAVLALLSCVNEPASQAAIESILITSLEDPNGYVPAVATEALVRLGSKTAVQASVRYLQDRRWDDTLRGRVKSY